MAQDHPTPTKAEVDRRTVLTGGALVIGALVFNELLGWKEQK